MTKQQLSQFGTILLSIVFLGVSLWALRHQLQEYSYSDILESLRNLPPLYLLIALLLNALKYIIITLYDVLALFYIRHSLSYPKIALTAFISTSFSGLGYGLLSSSILRYRFYSRWGLSNLEIVKIIGFMNLGLWVGMLTLSGFLLLLRPLTLPELIPIPLNLFLPAGILCLALVIVYLLYSYFFRDKKLEFRQTQLEIPPVKLTLAQIFVLTLDWAMAAGILFVLLYPAAEISYPIVLRNYLLAQVAGAVSNVPGGLGVFETIVILLFQGTISADVVLASLLAFRGVHYFLPLLVAGILLAGDEVRLRLK